ncbi:D-beta-hydroxybutyrate dehydrogenase-like [Saccostrea cucullata]|uniref:D-beta-hydroxybutyrate dehydrogenase-like n=1 Tax=Saccostrea cuccullata TaxID=36930 RepID=UPI002ED59492
MSLCLTGKTALVTGSTGKLGKTIIKDLVQAGCFIIATDRVPRYSADDFFEELNAVSNENMMYITCDLASTEDIENMFREIDKKRPDGVDIFVNNAASFCFGSLVEDITLEQWSREISINLTSAFMITQYVIPKMKDKGWGRVIYVSSQLGLTAIPKAAAYISSKSGLLGLTRAVAVEVADKGVTVNAVCPGPMDSGFIDDVVKTHAVDKNVSIQDAKQLVQTYLPTRRFSSATQISSFILYLCSPGADNMTGTSTSMDGGVNAM